MAMKKVMKPGVAARNAAREKFVSEKKASKGITTEQARQRFYVQTRMSELKAAGKPVDAAKRKELQKKFQSGDVARKGFAAPKKKTSGSPVVKPVAKRTDSSGRSGMGATAPKKATGAVAS